MLHQEIQLGNPSIGFAFRIFRSERTEQQGSPWRHSPTVAFLGQCSTRFSTGNWSQLSVEAVNAWAGNEPAFPCVHAFFEAVSMFPFCIGSGNGELCLWSRTSAWQTCIAPKDLILERLLEHLLRGSWRHLASLQPGCAQLTWRCYNSNTVLPTPHSLWQTFGKQRHLAANAIPESQDHFWLALSRGCAYLREGAFPVPSKAPAWPEPCCSTDLFVLSEYCCFLPFNIINKKMKCPEPMIHLNLFTELYWSFQVPRFYNSAEMVAPLPFLVQTSSNATSGVLLSSQGHIQIKKCLHVSHVEIWSTC